MNQARRKLRMLRPRLVRGMLVAAVGLLLFRLLPAGPPNVAAEVAQTDPVPRQFRVPTPARGSEATLVDETLPEVLVPRRPRDEAVEDRMHASALFAEGRLLFRREQFEQALARYERAYRYANGSTTVLDEVVPLAYRLGRLDEAARYAKHVSAQSAIDPFILRRLALYLTEQEEYAQALRLYEIAILGEEQEEVRVPTVITQFETGRLMYLTGRFADAVQRFDQVCKVLQEAEPSPADKAAVDALLAERQVTYSLMAETYLNADRPEQAGELFRRAYQDEPQAAILDFHLARVAVRQKDPDQALERLRRYLQTGNSDAGTAAYELLLELRGQKNEADQALAELEQLAQQQDDNVFLVYVLGEEYLKRQSPESAIRQFDHLMKIRPLVDGYRGLLRARIQQQDEEAIVRLLAEAVSQLGGLELLTEALDPLMADPPLHARVVDTARQLALAAESKESELSRRAIARGAAELLAYADDPRAADPFYQCAAGQGDAADVDAWLAWGMQRLASGQSAQAVEVFQGLLELTKDTQQQGPIYFYLAAALALDDRFDEALAAARQAADRVPNVPTIQLRPAWVLFLAKRWPEAAQAYQDFIARYGDQQGSPALRDVLREAKSSLSSVCVFLDRHDDAEEWLEQVLDEYPDDPGAHNDLGYLWADRGVHLQRALRMTEHACQSEPDNIAHRDSYGWALFRVGKFDEAVAELRKAAAVDEPDGVILDHLADALRATEGPAAAVPLWQRALEVLGKSEPARRTQIEQKIRQATAP